MLNAVWIGRLCVFKYQGLANRFFLALVFFLLHLPLQHSLQLPLVSSLAPGFLQLMGCDKKGNIGEIRPLVGWHLASCYPHLNQSL